MKITLYELLGMVKDGKAPKKILFDTEEYEWSKSDKAYIKNIGYHFKELDDDYNLTKCLNDTVEILEEEKKIPENNFNYIYSCEDELIMANFVNIKTTLNDIIDYLKSKGE